MKLFLSVCVRRVIKRQPLPYPMQLEAKRQQVYDQLEAGKFSALKAIHKYLFDEIYDFAGELRTVNISKGNFRFAPLMYLEAALANIDKMPQSTFDEIVGRSIGIH